MQSFGISRRNFIRTAAGAAAVVAVGTEAFTPVAHATSPGPDTRFTLDDPIQTISTDVTLAGQNTRLQSAFFGANGKLFTMQQPVGGGPNGLLLLSRVQWNSTTDSIGDYQASYGRMYLNGFGHGQQFGVSFDGVDHWIYMECDGRVQSGSTDQFGCKLCKFKWKEGDMVNSGDPYTLADITNSNGRNRLPGAVLFDQLQPRGSESNPTVSRMSCSIDTLTNKLVLRFFQEQGTPVGGTAYTGSAVGFNFALYDVAYDGSVNRLTNTSIPLQPCFKGLGGPPSYIDYQGNVQHSSPAQGMCMMENVIYEISGTGWDHNSCGPGGGDTGSVVIDCFDIRTHACYKTHITGALSLNIREPEGLWVQRTGTTQRLMFCLTSSPTCVPGSGPGTEKRANFYVKSDLTTVVLSGCSL